MHSSVGINFEWPQASEIAKELSVPGKPADVEMVATRITAELNALVPEYDIEHQFYSPVEAIEAGATTCKTRAYMAHLIAMQVTGVRSAVYLSIVGYRGHAATYTTNGDTAAVIDSTRIQNGGDNSFFVPYDHDPHIVNSTFPMIEYFRANNVTKGFAWINEDEIYGIEPSDTRESAESEPLCRELPSLYGMLMIGETGRLAMIELLAAKQEIADVKGPDLDDLLGDNCNFPNALVQHPQFI